MKIKRSAWITFTKGTTSQQLKDAARSKAACFLGWSVATLALVSLISWEWGLLPAILAVINGSQSFDASKLIPEIEALENILR